jgi:dienelactone hydrolase
MLAPLFHAWERYLASIAKDRKVRPFEWGLEWLSPNGPGTSDPADQLHRWVMDVMSDTRAFFHAPPIRDFDFEPASPGSHKEEAGTVRFPSAFVTPHPENNTVSGRWFPAGPSGAYGGRGPRPVRRSGPQPQTARSALCGRQRPDHGEGGSRPARAVVVLPQWNSNRGEHIGLSRLLARCGLSALRLSLPYHDDRMPPELSRADYIVSSNIARTVQVCRQAVLDAKRAIDWLVLQGYERIGILGTSLGSCLAMLTTAHDPRIRAQALNHVSPWFADVVWRGLSTRHVREGLNGHLELSQLRDLWRPISPFSYLDQVRHARTLLVYARYDLTFPVDLSRTLVQEFSNRNLPHEVSVLPCGHYSTGVAPFKYLDGFLLTQFLRRNL